MVKLFPPGARTEFVDLLCGGLSVIEASRLGMVRDSFTRSSRHRDKLS